MSRPFLLFHWSPRSRRASILRNGLCPGMKGRNADWRPPYLCFCRFTRAAWMLSAEYSDKPGHWDLWSVMSDQIGPYTTRNNFSAKVYWMTEYRSTRRIPPSKLWHVGTRKFISRRHK